MSLADHAVIKRLLGSMALTDEVLAEMPKRQPQIMNIAQWPNELLKQVSKPVVTDIKGDAALQALLDDMVLTMQRAEAVGLAAVQVGVPLRVLVVQVDDKPIKVINPLLKQVSAEQIRTKEGCLSFVGLYVDIKRPAKCVVEYFNENGEKCTTEGKDLLARAIQHEIDHLDGIVFLDRLTQLERNRAIEKHKVAKRRVKAVIKKMKK